MLDSGSYSVVSRELSNVFMPEPEQESEPPPSVSVQPFSSTPVPPTVHTRPPEPASAPRSGLVALGLFAAAAAGWLFVSRSSAPSAERVHPSNGAAAAVVLREPEPMLRVHGSNTIGSELGPALAEAYLRSKGRRRRAPPR